MATFQDSQGREWSIVLDFALRRKIRQSLKADYSKLDDLSAFARLSVENELLGESLWLFVESQATDQGVTQSDFWRGLDGDAMAAGEKAIRQAAVEFAPASARDALRGAFKALDRELEALTAKVCEDLDALQFPGGA